MIKNFILLLIAPIFLLANYEYSLEDFNSTSPTYREDVWLPSYTSHITLHYFSTQG